MTYDPTAAYRTAQVTTSSPVAQVVLLYEGAIRFATLSVHHLDQGELEAAHHASLRSQAIVSALRECLDLSAGDIAVRLDTLYDFINGRLVEGNLRKRPEPTSEAIALLRDLLAAWRQVNAPAAPAPQAVAPVRAATPAFAAAGAGVVPSGIPAPAPLAGGLYAATGLGIRSTLQGVA